jgi:hypothetical protein
MSRRTLCTLLILGLLVLGSQHHAPAASGQLAILIVGPSATSQSEEEVELANRLRQLLDEVGQTQVKPVRYHFDRPAERKHCEKKLKITGKDLVFAGVVRTDSRGVVIEVVYRQQKTQDNLEVAAQEVIYRFRKLKGILPPGG